jgi:hypothetical protein
LNQQDIELTHAAAATPTEPGNIAAHAALSAGVVP